MSAPSRFAALLAATLVGACAAVPPLPIRARSSAPAVAPSAARELAPSAARRPGAHAVLSTGKRAFVLTGALADADFRGERELLPGGFALSVDARGASLARRFTLVGPEGRCTAHATRAVRLSLDYGGYAGAALPGPKHSGFELGGCETLTHEHAFLLALDGDDPNAAWVHPAHVDEAQAPADRRLGESEVWLHRWALPKSDFEIVERNVLSFVTSSCSEERRDVLVVDELDHPVANHPGFYLRGAIQSEAGTLLVLMGHDEPEALRVVELGAAETHVRLDTRLALFQDVERPGC